MTTDNMIPTTGAYNVWLTSADDYDVWSLPVIGLVPHLVSYDGNEVSTEYEPAVLDHSGTVHELRDLDGATPRLFLGGFIVGVAPATLSAEQALAYLARFRVPLNPHAPDEDDLMGSPMQRAQRQARGEYTWPTRWQPAA
jgi:hypothetical protein